MFSLSIETCFSSLEKEDSRCGKLSKTGAESSLLCGTGQIAEPKFGYINEFLFFQLMLLAFTAKK